MYFGDDLAQLAFIAMVVIAVGGVALALFYPMLSDRSASQRVRAIAESKKGGGQKGGTFSKFMDSQKDSRRKQVQESLKQIEERAKQRNKRMSLRMLIMQSGLDISVELFWIFSVLLGVIISAGSFFAGAPWYGSVAAALAGTFGLPRWLLGLVRRRRQAVFLNDFADAIDVMVRGLKAGLPVSDAMKIIASESGPPVGPEFLEVVEGQRVGITIDQGIERMYDRMPMSEVNFLGIVMSIQAKTGGNLSEALNNLSKVLRDRKKLKAKIRAVSQEAKSSAAIIGSLPFVIMGALTILNPTYLLPMFTTDIGNVMLVGCGLWMLTGILVMRQMINFEI